MKVIPREAKRITYSTEIRKLKQKALNTQQTSVVVGTILGDGSLCTNWSKSNYRLKVQHSIKQTDYILWKYNILKDIVLTAPRLYDRTRSIVFQTISHPELTMLKKVFYPDGKKIIPPNIQDILKDPLALAVWFMDDGNTVRRNNKTVGYNINSQSFTKEENQTISDELRNVHGIHATLEKNKDKFRLAIFQKESRYLFTRIIEPYIVPSMQYKLG